MDDATDPDLPADEARDPLPPREKGGSVVDAEGEDTDQVARVCALEGELARARAEGAQTAATLREQLRTARQQAEAALTLAADAEQLEQVGDACLLLL